MFKYFLAWLPMVVLAIANGFFRETVIKRFAGNLAAHQLSTVSLLLLFTGYIWIIIKNLSPTSGKQAISIGLLWLILTLLFEFGFGRYRGNTWATLLADYNLLEGRVWVFIPLWVAIAPYILYKLSR